MGLVMSTGTCKLARASAIMRSDNYQRRVNRAFTRNMRDTRRNSALDESSSFTSEVKPREGSISDL
jgi:hypothetical protein